MNEKRKLLSRPGMGGTPTTILIDRAGLIRRHYFGQVDDLQLGADIASLIAGSDQAIKSKPEPNAALAGCDDDDCAV